MSIHEVTTLLRVRDEATAIMRRYVATLREAQVQYDAALGSFRELQALMAKSLSLASREAQIRTDIASNTLRQNDAIIASRRAMLDLDERSLAVQRKIAGTQVALGRGPGWRGAANRIGNDALWTGGGILGGLAYATQRAISFNQTALETDVALGGYNRSPGQRAVDIRALQRAAMAGSEATGFFSAQDILEGLKVAASSGARPLVERMGMGVFTQIAPALSRYMDVVGRLKGESADSAAMEAIRISHLAGSYTPAQISRTLNAQAALALLMPDRMSVAGTTLGYAMPTGMQLAGMSPEAIMALTATADQSGLGRGRAGSRLQNYISTIAVTQSKQREAAKKALRLSGAIDSHGNLDLMTSFDILQADSKRMGPQAYRDAVRMAFGASGSVVAAMFSDPTKAAMFNANRNVISQAMAGGDLTTIQNILKGGAAGKEALMMARLNNDIIKFGQYGLPIAVKFFDTINPKLKEFGDWLDKHPREASKMFDDLVHAGEGLLILGGALKGLAIVATVAKSMQALYSVVSRFGALVEAFASNPAVKWLANAPDFLTVPAIIGNIWGDLHDKHPHPTRPDKIDPRDMVPFGHYLPAWAVPGATPTQSSTHHAPVHISKIDIHLPNVKDGRTAARDIAAYLGGLASGSPQQLRSRIRANPGMTSHMEPPSLRNLDPPSAMG